MTDFYEGAVTDLLRSQLGRSATFYLYGREYRTPMTFLLDEVERQIGTCFSTYWVDGGPPEVFSLPGLIPSPVIFSTRFLSMTAFIRNLFVRDALAGVRSGVAERTALQLIAEFALRHGDPDFAVLAFVRAMTGKSIWFPESELMALELEAINEAYMATWFYGLTHEIGHLQPAQSLVDIGRYRGSDEDMIALIESAFALFPEYDVPVRVTGIEVARERRSDSVLGIDQLREEGVADIFAASILFRTSFEIMRFVGDQHFSVERFITEMVIFLNIIAIIERCRGVATMADTCTVEANEMALLEMALHPVAIACRALMQRMYLDAAVGLIYGQKPDGGDVHGVVTAINELNAKLQTPVTQIDRGLARAMEFAFYPERRSDERVLLTAFRDDLKRNALSLIETRRFCALAEDLNVSGRLLEVLRDFVTSQ